MGKLKALKEKRATIYTSIDELRQATDGREMTAEEQQRWDTMLSDYDKADKAVEAEERFVDIQRKQAEQEVAKRDFYIGDLLGEQYRKAFADYILNGASGISPESRATIEQRAGIAGLAGGVTIPTALASEIEIALKTYGGMFEAGTIINTSFFLDSGSEDTGRSYSAHYPLAAQCHFLGLASGALFQSLQPQLTW